MRYIPKVYLQFRLPDGTTRSGFFRQSRLLGDIITSFLVKGRTKLDQSKNIGQLGLKNDDLIEIITESRETKPKTTRVIEPLARPKEVKSGLFHRRK